MQSIINLFFLDTFYRLCAEFVQHYPEMELPCQRMQTFAAIESYADINKPNLGKTILDRDKPFFFSRKWAAANYNPSKLEASGPMMTAFEEPGLFVDPFDVNTKVVYNIQLAWLDSFEHPKTEDKRACAKRTRNELFIQSETFARNFFSYLAGVAYYEGVGFRNAQVAAAINPGAVEVTTITRQFVKMIKEENKQVQHVRWEGGINNLHGTYTTIKLCANTCDSFIYDSATAEYKLGFDRGCC
jgi:hypothetical protein